MYVLRGERGDGVVAELLGLLLSEVVLFISRLFEFSVDEEEEEEEFVKIDKLRRRELIDEESLPLEQ
jgi:hypothetical protein